MPLYLINIYITSSKAVEIPLAKVYKGEMFLILSHLIVSKYPDVSPIMQNSMKVLRLPMVASISRSLKMEGGVEKAGTVTFLFIYKKGRCRMISVNLNSKII